MISLGRLFGLSGKLIRISRPLFYQTALTYQLNASFAKISKKKEEKI
jgi:hypothetical protein